MKVEIMAAKTQEKPATETTTTTAAPAKTGARVAPEITTITANVPVPEKTRRGAKSLYPFDELEIGASFGVKNKTASNMASIVSNQNRRAMEVKKDETGAVVYKTKELKGADGTVTNVPTDEPEMVETKRFICADVDPKTDPAGASVRVWRQK